MQITRAVEYGAMGLMCLARRSPGETVMLEDISREEDISASFLGKIFQSLARAGLVRSVRGTGGGFTLTKSPETVSLLEVFEAIEGKLAFQRCLQTPAACEREESCALCGVFEQAQDQVKDVFSRTTLADLLKRHIPAGTPHRRAGALKAPVTLNPEQLLPNSAPKNLKEHL